MAKVYYTISEVSEIIDVKPHVLRYWEATLGVPQPRRKAGKRFYTPQDIRMAYLIKVLLYKRGYTLDKVSKLFKEHGPDKLSPVMLDPLLNDVREDIQAALSELTELKELLEER